MSRLFWLQILPNGGFVGLRYLYVGGCIHSLSICVGTLFLLTQIFYPKEMGGKSSKCGKACYWRREIGVCDVKRVNEVINDGVGECVL